MKTVFTTIVESALVILIGAVAFMYSGLYDVAASTSHSGLSNWAMSTTMQASMQRRAKDIDVPDLSDDALWPVVALMTKLPDLDATLYTDLVATADGHGHHAEGDDHAHVDDAMDNESDKQDSHRQDIDPTQHDHSTHEH